MHTTRLALIPTIVLAFGAALNASAHHAMEYISLEGYSTAAKGQGIFLLHYDYLSDDRDNPDADHWEITPGISYGVTDRLMASIHTHFAKFGVDHVVAERRDEFRPNGPSPFMEAVAGSLQYRLTEGLPVNIAVGVGLELPFDRARELLGSEDPVYLGSLILEREFGQHSNLTLNLGYESEGSEDEFAWALGVKTPLSAAPHGIAGGIEVFGLFDQPADNWSVLPGVYIPIGGQTRLKTGIEVGRDEGAHTLRASVSLMHIF